MKVMRKLILLVCNSIILMSGLLRAAGEVTDVGIMPHQQDGRYFLRTAHKPLQFYWHNAPVSCLLLGNKLWRRLSGTGSVSEDQLNAWLQRDEPVARSTHPAITWIGHSSFLIQVGGFNILTDPVLGDISLYPRLLPPGILTEQLPPIDLVLISHNHRDHMDETSLRLVLARNPQVKALVPVGNKQWFDRAGFVDVVEHTWWEDTSIGSDACGGVLSCTFVPADHWSQRGLRDYNTSLWGGWIMRHGDQTIYFAGDTAYDEQIFDEIAQKFAPIMTALMPISPCRPAALRSHHMNAAESVGAFVRLGARHLVPTHWAAFAMGTDEFEAPVRELKSAWLWRREDLINCQLCMVKAGQRLVFE